MSNSFIQLHDKTFEPYLSEKDLDEIIQRLADQINSVYCNKQVTIVVVLNGAFMFASDLTKKLKIDCEIKFVRYSSYQGTESTGIVKTLVGLDDSFKGKHILVIEDIVDTGHTLHFLLEDLGKREAASMEIVSLLFKPAAYQYTHPIQFIGLEIPNRFVVGYGLDYDELGRNLPSIYQLVKEQ